MASRREEREQARYARSLSQAIKAGYGNDPDELDVDLFLFNRTAQRVIHSRFENRISLGSRRRPPYVGVHVLVTVLMSMIARHAHYMAERYGKDEGKQDAVTALLDAADGYAARTRQVRWAWTNAVDAIDRLQPLAQRAGLYTQVMTYPFQKVSMDDDRVMDEDEVDWRNSSPLTKEERAILFGTSAADNLTSDRWKGEDKDKDKDKGPSRSTAATAPTGAAARTSGAASTAATRTPVKRKRPRRIWYMVGVERFERYAKRYPDVPIPRVQAPFRQPPFNSSHPHREVLSQLFRWKEYDIPLDIGGPMPEDRERSRKRHQAIGREFDTIRKVRMALFHMAPSNDPNGYAMFVPRNCWDVTEADLRAAVARRSKGQATGLTLIAPITRRTLDNISGTVNDETALTQRTTPSGRNSSFEYLDRLLKDAVISENAHDLLRANGWNGLGSAGKDLATETEEATEKKLREKYISSWRRARDEAYRQYSAAIRAEKERQRAVLASEGLPRRNRHNPDQKLRKQYMTDSYYDTKRRRRKATPKPPRVGEATGTPKSETDTRNKPPRPPATGTRYLPDTTIKVPKDNPWFTD